MPKVDEFPIGAPCWADLFTSDPTKSQAFYGELFGWTCEDAGPDFGHYLNFSKDGIRVAGGMRNDRSAGTPDGWNVYLKTDDAKATVDAAASNGGQVIVPAMDVGDLGTMAVVIDPGGAAIGMWQPREHKGFGLRAEAGAPSWFELLTRDYANTVAFYRKVFRWNTQVMSDTPELRYTTLMSGDDALAGIYDASGDEDDLTAYWQVYFGTTDADATLARAVKLGGAMVTPAEDTPYGRLATVSDPTGARFRITQDNPSA